jgi:hypothetical protein
MELEGGCSKIDPEREVHQARPDRVPESKGICIVDGYIVLSAVAKNI